MSLIPDYCFKGITDIPMDFFSQRKIKMAILDIDNTLTEDGAPDISYDVEKWIKRVQAEGIILTIVSNNHRQRVEAFAEKIFLPYVCEAKKPSQKCLADILAKYMVTPFETAVIGDQLFTDIWFAKRAGMVSVLVEPIGPDYLIGVMLKRFIEKPILSIWKRKGKFVYYE